MNCRTQWIIESLNANGGLLACQQTTLLSGSVLTRLSSRFGNKVVSVDRWGFELLTREVLPLNSCRLKILLHLSFRKSFFTCDETRKGSTYPDGQCLFGYALVADCCITKKDGWLVGCGSVCFMLALWSEETFAGLFYFQILTWNEVGSPPELKHINKGRKRKQLWFP